MPLRASATTLLLILAAAAAATAQTYTSSGTGGELLSKAQIISSPGIQALTDITGSLPLVNGTSGGNLFEIYISDPTNFSASTLAFTNSVNTFDTQLFLFNSSGIGIEANDDNPNNSQIQSLLPSDSSYLSNLSIGNYYLLIEGNGRYPTDASGNLIFPNLTISQSYSNEVVGPTGPGGASALGGFTGNSGGGGAYSIQLTGAGFIAPIPEPSPLPLLALGVTLFCFQRSRRAHIH
jgi:hypothetical protein